MCWSCFVFVVFCLCRDSLAHSDCLAQSQGRKGRSPTFTADVLPPKTTQKDQKEKHTHKDRCVKEHHELSMRWYYVKNNMFVSVCFYEASNLHVHSYSWQIFLQKQKTIENGSCSSRLHSASEVFLSARVTRIVLRIAGHSKKDIFKGPW